MPALQDLLPPPDTDDVSAWHSLRTRVLLGAGLGLLLLLVVLGTLFYLGARNELVDAARKEVDGLTQQTAGRLAAVLDSVQVSGHTLAAAATGVGEQPFNLRALLQATLAGDADIAGAMVIVAPGTQKRDDDGFVWYLRRDGDRIVEQSVQDLGYDYRQMPWYRRTLQARTAWWSEPYANANTGGELFTTYNLPLHRPGDAADAPAVGMVSVDVPLKRLQAAIGQLPREIGLQPLLLSPEGLFVLAPDPALNLRRTLAQHVQRRPDLVPLQRAIAGRRDAAFEHTTAEGERYLTRSAAIGRSGWTFVLSASERYVLAGLNGLALWLALGALVGAGLWWLLMRRVSARLTRPIEDLTDTAGHFRRGEFDYPLAHTGRRDEVGVMARAFDAARTSIQGQIDEIAQMSAARERLQRELEIARDIQQAMLPASRSFDTAHAHLDAAALLEPAKTVGGDFYHFFETAPGQLWFVVGDVSDKGVPAALFMARAVSVLETAALRYSRPDAILAAAAPRLAEHNDACMFATVLCGLIDVDSGDYWLASAGHEPPLLLGADGMVEPLALETGPALGLEVEVAFPVLHGRMQAGQTLLGYTDGVTDAPDANGAGYGLARLAAALPPGRTAAEQCQAVLDDVRRHCAGTDQFDDITLLAIRLRHDAAMGDPR